MTSFRAFPLKLPPSWPRLPAWNSQVRRVLSGLLAGCLSVAALSLSRSSGLDGGSAAHLATIAAAFSSWSAALSLFEDRPVLRLRGMAWLLVSLLWLGSLGVLVRPL